ncbi:adenylyl-sulfate kinase [Candidatus Saccharibacteria bacterium]|nr:adenylyl-sulfate kinase [Calditrichia bacterium]NIV97864.1 adenylyl-sulfate kinase [Candidatus Saccharibacteria bacterium]NIW78150.1 adenylyl-sulfate kinase [Calditrichia bacterium]
MDQQKATNIYWHDAKISKADRERVNNHRGFCIWFTGLSGSGKSTLANEVQNLLFERGVRTYVLDGDNIRHGLNKNLGFSAEDRAENIRRIGEVAKLFADAGLVVMTAFISPYREDRDKVRQLLDKGDFVEIYVECDLDVCEDRDPKGLYKKARAGEIANFTGISDPYEAPDNPELIVNTSSTPVEESAQEVIRFLEEHSYLTAEKLEKTNPN